MEITRSTPQGRQVIQKYGSGGFTVSGARYAGPVLVLPAASTAWQAGSLIEIDAVALAAALRAANVSLCIIGCGVRTEPMPPTLRGVLKEAGISVDAMETGAACRTYNMLAGEGRAVAAALIPY